MDKYKKLKSILKFWKTTTFGADTNYNFVNIGKNKYYYKFSIKEFNQKTFNETMKDNHIFNSIVNKIIKEY